MVKPRFYERPLWFVQTNLGNQDVHREISEICARHNYRYHGIKIIPFTIGIPDYWPAGPIIAYGSTRFIANIARSKWRSAVFFDESIFKVSNYAFIWKKHLLNQDAYFSNLCDVHRLPFLAGDEVFCRPDGDLKEFAGEVMTFAALCNWAKTISTGNFEFDDFLPVLVASPKRVRREWRIFVTEDKGIIASSQYRVDGRLAPQEGCPIAVEEFVNDRIDEWCPVPAFALDVCEIDGALKIVELTDFHSAGFYAANLEDIVVEVSQTAVGAYRSRLSKI